ncbi:hypothetical protein DH86_00003270, partial [Scytalidium sp. 3C]
AAESGEESENEAPSTQRGRNRRPVADDSDDEDNEAEEEDGEDMDIDGENTLDQSVKKLVRYALACEYSRIPISRTGIREKTAGKSNGASKQPTSYILTTILPPAYRIPAIIPPSIVPSEAEEASYVALCTVVVSLIALNGGQLPEHKLDRYLSRMNADENMPMDKTQ